MLTRWLAIIGVAASVTGVPAQAQTVPIPGLFNTGANGAGGVIGDGQQDSHYTIISTPANPAVNTPGIAVNEADISGVWVPNSATSRWIWATANGVALLGPAYTFRLTFDLTGLDPGTATITGKWAVDNLATLRLNGVDKTNTNVFDAFHTFTLTSGFVSGQNTIDFVVTDQGVIGGLRVEGLTGTASVLVPELHSAELCLLPLLAGLWLDERFRRLFVGKR